MAESRDRIDRAHHAIGGTLFALQIVVERADAGSGGPDELLEVGRHSITRLTEALALLREELEAADRLERARSVA